MEQFGVPTSAFPIFSGENYQAWAVKMQAFMEGADLWEAVEEDYEVAPLPNDPTMNQLKMRKEKVTRKAKAKSCLFSAVSPTIFTRIMQIASAHEIWRYLRDEYQGDERIRGMKVLNLLREFERQQMKESEKVKEFVDRLVDIANQIRVLGTEIDDRRLVQKILVAVPERYEATIASLENTKDISEIKLSEVLSALQAQEQRRMMRREEPLEGALQARLKLNADAGQNQGSSSSGGQDKRWNTVPCKHCGRKNHPHFRCWRRPDIKCRRCHKMGHVEAICQERGQNQQQEAVGQTAAAGEVEHLFTASCFISNVSRDGWLVDSGCTNHMTSSEGLFSKLDKSVKSKVRIGNGECIDAEGKGEVVLEGPGGVKLISEVLFVPKIAQNLLSVGQLVEKGLKVVFEKGECAIGEENGHILFKIPMRNKCFSFDPVSEKHEAMKSTLEEEELWHKRMGHYHSKGLQYLQQNEMAVGLPVLQKELANCKSCLLGKQVRLPFKKSNWRAMEKLQLIHTDVCGPMPEESLNGSKYFVTFIDDCTRLCWVYFMKEKAEVDEVFSKFKRKVETESGCRIKTVRSDNGGEYTSSRFKAICEEAGIKHQYTVPYTPQQNGVSERKNRSIMEMARCMLQEKELPKKFWAEAASTAVFLLNRLPTKALNKQTPFEAWHGYKPKVSNLKVFGCICYNLVPSVKRDKLDQRGEEGIFVGYSLQAKAYRVYKPTTNKVMVSRDVSFLEDKKWDWSIDDAEESSVFRHDQTSQEEQQESEVDESVEEQQESEVDESVDDVPVRGTRSLTEIYERCNVAMMEPESYEDAQKNEKWAEAMEEELRMIERNHTWNLVDRPQNRKIIGVKWVYRTKLNPDGTVNKHKARLVVKGYAQVWGVDYSETFAPVARMDTIRLLLATAAQKSWKVYQLDVKSAFLNGELKEEIYVEQPEGFVIKGREDSVYKLRKALYGLKQAPRAWYSKIDRHLQELGFEKSLSESTLYVQKSERGVAVLSLYVDDLLVTGEDENQITEFKRELMRVFEMTDLGEMSFFLGMEVQQRKDEVFICQRKYLREILKRFKMEECRSVSTPMNLKEKLQRSEGAEPADEGFYRSLVGCLMYLTATRPDIMYAVGVLSRFLSCASEEHMVAAKRVVRYLKGTQSSGIKFTKVDSCKLQGYADSDWAGSAEDMRSTTGYCFTLGSGCFSWSSKKQEVVAQSTAEAEFIAATAAANQAIWLRKLLTDLVMEEEGPTEIRVDNQAALAISQNPVFHGKTKHFKIKFYFLREVQEEGEVKLIYCKTEDQVADMFTKPLQANRFELLKRKVGMYTDL